MGATRAILFGVMAGVLAACGGAPSAERDCTSAKDASAYIAAIQAPFLADAKSGKVSTKKVNAYLDLVAEAAEKTNRSKDYVGLCKAAAAKLSEFGYGPQAD